MSFTESLSTFPEIYNEFYTLSSAKYVFSRMRDRCPKEYEEQKLSLRQAAELLNVDPKTIRQRVNKGQLKCVEDVAGNYIKRKRVSIRDIADMIIAYPLRPTHGNAQNKYSSYEIEELKTTGKVEGRSYDSYHVKACRMGIKLKDLKDKA
jgi:hypothetical protein